MQNETQKEIAGIQSATSRQNTKDQVYAQNEMLAYQQKESTARVASIMENTNLSKQQQVSEIMRQMLTQAQTAGQYFTNEQIKEMTRKVSAEVDLVHQQTQNQRYGSSHIGATAKDISNVVTDAASGVVDIFHSIDKAVADTWNNFWKDGKADGIGSNLSRKDRKSGSAGMPRPISYAVFCLKKKKYFNHSLGKMHKSTNGCIARYGGYNARLTIAN